MSTLTAIPRRRDRRDACCATAHRVTRRAPCLRADAIRACGRGGGTPPPRKDVRIELYDGERRQTIAWLLKRALPVKFQAPDFNTAGNDVAMEELTLAYESLAREDDPLA